MRAHRACAFSPNPSLLLLDEATSHLDVNRERAVNEAIRGTRMTRIVIAHRPETIRPSERVIVVDRGKLILDESTGKRNPARLQQAAFLQQAVVPRQ